MCPFEKKYLCDNKTVSERWHDFGFTEGCDDDVVFYLSMSLQNIAEEICILKINGAVIDNHLEYSIMPVVRRIYDRRIIENKIINLENFLTLVKNIKVSDVKKMFENNFIANYNIKYTTDDPVYIMVYCAMPPEKDGEPFLKTCSEYLDDGIEISNIDFEATFWAHFVDAIDYLKKQQIIEI